MGGMVGRVHRSVDAGAPGAAAGGGREKVEGTFGAEKTPTTAAASTLQYDVPRAVMIHFYLLYVLSLPWDRLHWLHANI